MPSTGRERNRGEAPEDETPMDRSAGDFVQRGFHRAEKDRGDDSELPSFHGSVLAVAVGRDVSNYFTVDDDFQSRVAGVGSSKLVTNPVPLEGSRGLHDALHYVPVEIRHVRTLSLGDALNSGVVAA